MFLNLIFVFILTVKDIKRVTKSQTQNYKHNHGKGHYNKIETSTDSGNQNDIELVSSSLEHQIPQDYNEYFV